MSEWTPAAERAIALCEQWATAVKANLDCQLYLFGSVIYKGGEQFDSSSSDLDIVCLLPSGTDALARFQFMKSLKAFKQHLELLMVPALHRQTCDEPGVSIVVITDLELLINIHKSGARRFFDKNFFYDLSAKRETLGIPLAGTRIMREERRQALEYVQKVRNDYLSVCANWTGGLTPYVGQDPLPKSLMRSAAQLVPNVADGEWYDTQQGLDLLYGLLLDKRTESDEYRALFNKVSVRRGARGQSGVLSDDDQLLLAEMLCDEGANVDTEAVVTWDIRVKGAAATVENVRTIFESIKQIIPDATLIGHWTGSVILRIRSAMSGFSLMKKLIEHKVLAEVLAVQDVAIKMVDAESSEVSTFAREGVLARLTNELSNWRPNEENDFRVTETEFADFLERKISASSLLPPLKIEREVFLKGSNKRQILDFLVTWEESDGTIGHVAIEVTRLNTPSSFFNKLSRLVQLDIPVMLIVFGPDSGLARIRGDIARLGKINANVEVISVPLERG